MLRRFRCVCCVCVCVVLPFILDVRFVAVPAGVTQEEGHTGFLHLPSAVLAFFFSRDSKNIRASFARAEIVRDSIIPSTIQTNKRYKYRQKVDKFKPGNTYFRLTGYRLTWRIF